MEHGVLWEYRVTGWIISFEDWDLMMSGKY
jgi:hypothetical protein